jgi:hypothetical protein
MTRTSNQGWIPRPSTAYRFLLLEALWVLLAAAVGLGRLGSFSAINTLWADDGVFISQAFGGEAFGHFLDPYNGYLHALPRVLSEVAVLGPVAQIGTVMSVSSALVLGLLSAVVYRKSAAIIRSTWGRILLAGLVVLLPASAWEAANNAANLQWHLLFPCFLVLLSAPRSAGGAAAGSVLTLVTGLTAPLAILFVPVAVWKALTLNRLIHRAVPIFLLVGLIAQALVVMGARGPGAAPSEPFVLFPLFGFRVVGSLLIGEWFLEAGWRTLGWFLGYLGLGFLAGLITYVLLRRDLPRRSLILLLVVYSFLLFALSVLLRGTSLVIPQATQVLSGSRWVIAPELFLACALITILERPDRRFPPWVWNTIRSGLLLSISLSIIFALGLRTSRSVGPRWHIEVSKARRSCLAVEANTVTVPISPPGWKAKVPCEEILRR